MMRVEQSYDDVVLERNKANQNISKEVPYLVFEARDEDEALDAVYEEAPKFIGNLSYDRMSTAKREDNNTFRVTVYYIYDENSDPSGGGSDGEADYQFDTGGGTRHVERSIRTVSTTPSSEAYPGGINTDDDGHINGIDITMPVFNFSETHIFPPSRVSTSYKKALMEQTGKVNNSSFRGFNAGEVLCLGVSGSRRGDSSEDNWAITFKFAVSQNQSNIRIDALTVPSKQGWDYLWVQYKSAEVSQGGKTKKVKVPRAAFVEQVYEKGNFGALGIGS